MFPGKEVSLASPEDQQDSDNSVCVNELKNQQDSDNSECVNELKNSKIPIILCV